MDRKKSFIGKLFQPRVQCRRGISIMLCSAVDNTCYNIKAESENFNTNYPGRIMYVFSFFGSEQAPFAASSLSAGCLQSEFYLNTCGRRQAPKSCMYGYAACRDSRARVVCRAILPSNLFAIFVKWIDIFKTIYYFSCYHYYQKI